VIAARQFEVVILRARSAAERLEIEPDHAVAATQRRNLAPEYLDAAHRCALAASHRGEVLGHFQLGSRIRRIVEDLDLFEGSQAVVDTGIDLQNVETLLDQRNRRQEVLALQAIRVEPIGRVVGRHHEDDAPGKQRFEQPSEDHRIGNVGYVELVEAQQAHLGSDPVGNPEQWIALTLQLVQLAMDAVHEGMEVNPALAPVGHRVEEAIHQEALAAPHAAPEIDATRQIGRGKEPPQGAATPDLERQQRIVKALQALGGRPLRSVGSEVPYREQALVGVEHAALGDAENSVRHQLPSGAWGRFLVDAGAGRWRPLQAPRRTPLATAMAKF